MKPAFALGLAAIVAAALVAVTVLGLRSDPVRPPADDRELHERIAGLEQQTSELLERLRALERGGTGELSRPDVLPAPAPVARATPSERRDAIDRDPRWYLEQYVSSFDAGGEGSEYFRLVVDAYVAELVDPISEHVRDIGRPLALRTALVGMFGKRRLRTDLRVADALLGVVRQRAPQPLALAALTSFRRVADASISARLESFVWTLADDETVCAAALEALVELASERVNALLLRLLGTCPDDRWLAILYTRLDGADLESALAAFERAPRLNQPVRLAAAHKLGEYPAPPFVELVERWLAIETDAAVIAALGGARDAQRSVADWSAMQVVGPPDADPRQDDRRAWASSQADMGVQWIEVVYANPDRARAVRIHEVHNPGALSELRARDDAGEWHLLWTGSSPSVYSGPFEIAFAPTSYRVSALRIVLDTNRTGGWNEIDAVELVGLSGGQWASSASASSSYGTQRAKREGLRFSLR